MTDPGVIVYGFRAVDMMIMAQVYFQAIFLGVLPVRSSEYMVLIQDPVFVPVIVEYYTEITSPAVFIV
jgi:hypothetical protein